MTAKDRFGPIRTWSEFKPKWNSVDTEAAAVGLLYAGVKINSLDGESPPDKNACFVEKAYFYLWATTVSNKVVSTTAKQLIAKGLLDSAMGLSWGGDRKVMDAYRKILDFLGDHDKALFEPPYPRIIVGFLWNAWHRVRAVHAPQVDESYGNLRRENWEFEPVVRALLAWGAAGALVHRDAFRHPPEPEKEMSLATQARKILPYVEAFLESNEVDKHKALANAAAGTLQKTKLIPDFTEEGVAWDAIRRAALVRAWCESIIAMENAAPAGTT